MIKNLKFHGYSLIDGQLKIRDPIKDKKIYITVLADGENFAELVKLIPKVEELTLGFSDDEPKYDLKPLIKLEKIKKLIISKKGEQPRLLNLNILKKLNLKVLKLYGETLDPKNPIYEWPLIRREEFKHIINIRKINRIVLYEISVSDSFYLSEKDEYTGNIYLQKNGKIYFMVGCFADDNDVFFNQISEKKFNKIISPKGNLIPLEENDLYEEDND